MKLLTKALQKKFDQTKPYDGDDSFDAPVLAKFFGGSSCTWIITSAEKDGDDYRMYGYATLGYGYEYGSVMLSELQTAKFPPFGLQAERDLYLPKNCKVKDLISHSDLM